MAEIANKQVILNVNLSPEDIAEFVRKWYPNMIERAEKVTIGSANVHGGQAVIRVMFDMPIKINDNSPELPMA